jgi:hypothetical protein
MFETITLYDNQVKNATSKKLANGRVSSDNIEFDVRKLQSR